MKKHLFYFFMLFLIVSNALSQIKNDSMKDRYNEISHKRITYKAYEFLTYKCGIFVPEFSGHIGYPDQEYDEPWSTGKILAGADREDKEDPVFGWGFPLGGTVSQTHFLESR